MKRKILKNSNKKIKKRRERKIERKVREKWKAKGCLSYGLDFPSVGVLNLIG